MSESEYRMIEILRVLANRDQPTGSKVIADELKEKGFNLGERAVRYHMQILDEKGYTEKKSYSGRVITDLGREKLEKGLIYDQVDFIYSKFEEMIYLTDFTYMTQEGNVVVNTSTIYNEESIEIMKEIYKSGLSVSPYVNINEDKTTGEIEVTTICGTTIDGVLLKEGIPTQPQYGGLLKIENNQPVKFTEIISYKKTSVTPLDAFANSSLTSVLDVITKGSGLIPANFRLIPGVARERTIEIVKELIKIGIGGVIGISKEGEDLLGLPVPDGMVGMAIIGGITPFCAVKEMGGDIDLKIAEKLQDFNSLKPITSKMFPPLISLVLSKSLNLIQQVNFDVEKQKGDIIANISYVHRDDIDRALSIMEDTYNSNPKFINPYYKLVDHPENDDMVGIATICSLSIDGILINNGIMSNPTYSGLLELTEPPLFIDLISYNGTTLDPHKIFLSKNMTSITGGDGPSKILASVKEIPYISRDHAVELLEIKESGVPIQVKALEKMMPFEKMERL